jgi:LmbE family N-acetylglucosaminyl deacetylase
MAMAPSADVHGGGRCAMHVLGATVGSLWVIAAHPDDETIGVGASRYDFAQRGWTVQIVHATDGAPADGALRPSLRTLSVREAAATRRAELEAALRVGGLDPAQTLAAPLDFPDQQAALALPALARKLAERLAAARPDVVITHAYEGGHPDHDAVAFAVRAALDLLGSDAPSLAEMSSYHAGEGRYRSNVFIADAAQTSVAASCPSPPRANLLDTAARQRKRRMLDAFASQAGVLAPFAARAEPLRCAPRYDFSRPPHEGVLHYETLNFGWDGARWRSLAQDARAELGLR